MPGGKGNIKGSDNTNGFQKNPDNINKKGAPEGKRITTILKHILNNDMDKVREDLKGKDGNEVAALELLKIALSPTSKDNDKLSALKEIMDRVDGKAKQEIGLETKGVTLKVELDGEENKDTA